MNGNCYFSEGINPTVTCNKNEGNKIAIPVLTPDRIHKRQNGRRFKEEGDDMFTLTSIDRHGVALKIRVANKQGYDIAREREDSINFSYPTSNTRRGRVGVGVAQTLDTKCEQGVAVIAGLGEKKSNGGTQFYQQDRVYDGEGTATSLNSQLPGGGQMYGIKPQENVDTIYYPKGDCQIAIRKLTPKECFRLQAVPDELFERAKFVNSDAQLYKQAGNAVTATVVYALAKKLTKGQK